MENNIINKLLDITSKLSQIKDLDLLLEKILLTARNIINADAGSIYIKENKKLKFFIAQNDTLQKRLEPGKKMVYSVFTLPIDNSTLAGYVAKNGKMLNIKDVYKLDDSHPYKFGKQFDIISNYRTKSILTIPLKNFLGNVVGVIQIINPKDKKNKIVSFKKKQLPLIEFFANSAAIAIERAQLTREMILRMIKMAELRDPKETGAHVNRVGAYSIEIYEEWAKRNKINKKTIEKNKDLLRMASMLHDVGKVGISDKILKKPGKYTSDEFKNMKMHTLIGAKLFVGGENSELDEISSLIALNHHERWDGKGYPGFVNPMEKFEIKKEGKKGEEIPFFARIVAIADVYDALSSNRSYKEAWDQEKVKETIKNDSGKHFDPELVDCFFTVYDNILALGKRYS